MNGRTRDIVDYLQEQWLSNCCAAPPVYGLTPAETDYCSECGEHCEFENSEQEVTDA